MMKSFCLASTAFILAAFPGATTAQQTGFDLQFGETRPEHQALRAWVSATPQFRRALTWLGEQIEVPVLVPVVFKSCGEPNAFYYPATRSIGMCYEWITRRQNLVRANLSSPTPDMITDAVMRSTLNVFYHEAGHALVDLLDIPVLGREEDAADGFGAFILLERGLPQDAYTILQGAQSFSQRWLFEGSSEADVHSLNDQRYFNLLCWMLGSDQVRFGGLAQQAALPKFRQRYCTREWTQLREGWTKVLGARLRPVATASATPASTTPIQLIRSQAVKIEGGKYWRQVFSLPAGSCRAHVNVLGTDGGNRSVVAMIFDQYNFNSWVSGARVFEAAFESGQSRQVVVDVPLKGPSDFVFVVSNKHAVFTNKAAQVELSATCS